MHQRYRQTDRRQTDGRWHIANVNVSSRPLKTIEKREVLKAVSVGAEVTSGGKVFQRRLPATGNARSPTVDNRVRRITSCKDDDDRKAATVGINDELDVIGKVRGARPRMQASVDEHGQLEAAAFRRPRRSRSIDLTCWYRGYRYIISLAAALSSD